MPEALAENPLRKAAVFIRSLAPDAAATMLARLSPDEAKSLRHAISELGDIASGERSGLADELREQAETGGDAANSPEPASARPTSTAASVDGGAVELMLGGDEAMAASRAESIIPPPAATDEPPFDLTKADPATIAEYLRSEQPTAIALALGQLPASHAASVLAHFPVEQQGTLLSRVAGHADADPESVRLVTDGLVAWVQQREDENRRRRERIATIEQILSATPPEHRGRLLAQLREEEPDVAAAIAPPPPTRAKPRSDVGVANGAALPSKRSGSIPRDASGPALSDTELERLDGATLATAARSLDSRTAILALATASDSVVGRLSATLGRPAARELRLRLRRLGPATLSEIDRAKEAFARAAARVVADRKHARATPRPR